MANPFMIKPSKKKHIVPKLRDSDMYQINGKQKFSIKIKDKEEVFSPPVAYHATKSKKTIDSCYGK